MQGCGCVWRVTGGSVCENSDATSCYECHTFVLDPGALPNTSLSFMSVFSFCTLKWWGAILASHPLSGVGKKSFSRVTGQVIARSLK